MLDGRQVENASEFPQFDPGCATTYQLKFTLELELHYISQYRLPRAGRAAQRNMIAGSGLEEAISHTVGRPLVPPPRPIPGNVSTQKSVTRYDNNLKTQNGHHVTTMSERRKQIEHSATRTGHVGTQRHPCHNVTQSRHPPRTIASPARTQKSLLHHCLSAKAGGGGDGV